MSDHPECLTECAAVLRRTLALDREGALDVTISAAPPLVAGPYTTDPFFCPHGTAFWIEPTGEQIATWVREGTR